MKDKSEVTTNCRAVFYSVMWESFRKIALEHGWTLALHGSMASDMDIMAMPWTEDAAPIETVIGKISDSLESTLWKDRHVIPHFSKPHGRIVFTLAIMGDFYIDISVMPKPESSIKNDKFWESKHICVAVDNPSHIIHIIKTGHKDNNYIVLHEDAFEMLTGNTEILTNIEILEKCKINVKK